MRVFQGKTIASQWVQAYAQTHGMLGAVFNGSVLDLREDDVLPVASDVDINIILHPGQEEPGKIGKFRYQGVMLDVGFLPYAMIHPMEKALTTYEIAASYRQGPAIYDLTGYLADVMAYVSARFTQPKWVQVRCEAVFDKIERGIKGFSHGAALLDNVNSWLFPAGICAHAVLVAALRNPTVRLRYLRAREVLEKWDEMPLYDEMLALLDGEMMTAGRLLRHIGRLDEVFTQAIAQRRSYFPFQGDIAEESRGIAVDAARRLVQDGNYREASFWVAVTFERCMRILRQDAPETFARYEGEFAALLTDMGVASNVLIEKRIEGVLGFLPRLKAVVERHFR